MLIAWQEPGIEGEQHDGESLNACRIRVARIDEHVVGLRHQHGANGQYRSLAFSEPAISPGPRHGDASGPIGRQLPLIDRLPRNLFGDVYLDETVAGECRGLADLAVYKNLEHRGRRVRRAIENLLATRMPTRGGQQAPSPVE